MSKGLKITIIVVSMIVSVAGIIFMIMSKAGTSKLSEQTTIVIKGETKKTVKAELEGMYPGSNDEYEIILEGEGDSYQTTIRFRGNEDSELKEYIDVKVIAGEEEIDKSLSELIKEGENISLGENRESVKLIFTMREDAGNETQGKDISFYIDVMVGNTGE